MEGAGARGRAIHQPGNPQPELEPEPLIPTGTPTLNTHQVPHLQDGWTRGPSIHPRLGRSTRKGCQRQPEPGN